MMSGELNRRVLVVDDESSIREMLDEYLSKHGYRVLQAESAARARELLRWEAGRACFAGLASPSCDNSKRFSNQNQYQSFRGDACDACLPARWGLQAPPADRQPDMLRTTTRTTVLNPCRIDAGSRCPELDDFKGIVETGRTTKHG
ncbi:MAG: hypothetical protein H6R26_1798 [Proteobacteria bacterium]|nr:hypothetical protein [Pseudomonadota bacterium]